MAFVVRSERKLRLNSFDKLGITVGPGEYDEGLSKIQARLLRTNHMKFSTVMKTNEPKKEIPFNSTSTRNDLFETNNFPGPGAYLAKNTFGSLTSNFNNTSTNNNNNSINKPSLSIIIQQEGMPTIGLNLGKPNPKGFLSGEARFNKTSISNEMFPGPGAYNLKSVFTEGGLQGVQGGGGVPKNRIGLENGRICKIPGSPGSNGMVVTTIPDKKKGEFKVIDGHLTEIKKQEINGDPLGPGKYNLFPKWESNIVGWDKGIKKENKNEIDENNIKEELENKSKNLNNLTYIDKMKSFNSRTDSFSFNNYNQNDKSFNKSKFLSTAMTCSTNNFNTNFNNYNISITENNLSKSNTNNINNNTSSNITNNISTNTPNYFINKSTRTFKSCNRIKKNKPQNNKIINPNNDKPIKKHKNLTNESKYIHTSSEKLINTNSRPRDRIFHNFLKGRDILHEKNMLKLQGETNVLLEHEYKDSPGPGFYTGNINNGSSKNLSTSTQTDKKNLKQNFGSNSPKFFELKTENNILGPGAYFREKNKYEPKFETKIHFKFPEPIKVEDNNNSYNYNNNGTSNIKDIPVFLKELKKKNKENHPGPGQYELEGNLIKKEISKVNSFGSNVERFNYSKSCDKNEDNEENQKESPIKNNKKKNKLDNIYEYNNYKTINNTTQTILREEFLKHGKNEINKKKLEYIKEEQAKKRQKYIEKISPPVGSYSPEIISSISYGVLSKLNPYRNKVAPFNIIGSRFFDKKIKKFTKTDEEIPGPADYDVQEAFNALNLDKKKYKVFGQNKQRENNIKNAEVPGPGDYNLDNPGVWNKKTYNILFINNNYS